MLSAALLAYIHYVSFLLLVSTLVTELIVFSPTLHPRARKILQKADALYGLSAMLVLITGFVRVFFHGKGSEYYFHNYIFLAKVGLFLLVGLLSVYPTVIFLRWKKNTEASSILKLEPREYNKIRRLILLEVIFAFLIPLFAALMARGLGYFG